MFSKKETQKATLNYIHKTRWQVAKPLAGNVLKAVVLRGAPLGSEREIRSARFIIVELMLCTLVLSFNGKLLLFLRHHS